MPARRKTGGYSPAYEKRLKAFFAKNPHGTLAEARGHKLNVPDTEDRLILSEYAIKEKIKLQQVFKKLGIITEKERLKNITDLQALSTVVRKIDVILAKSLPYWELKKKGAEVYKKLEQRGVLGKRVEDDLASLLFYHGG